MLRKALYEAANVALTQVKRHLPFRRGAGKWPKPKAQGVQGRQSRASSPLYSIRFG